MFTIVNHLWHFGLTRSHDDVLKFYLRTRTCFARGRYGMTSWDQIDSLLNKVNNNWRRGSYYLKGVVLADFSNYSSFDSWVEDRAAIRSRMYTSPIELYKILIFLRTERVMIHDYIVFFRCCWNLFKNAAVIEFIRASDCDRQLIRNCGTRFDPCVI